MFTQRIVAFLPVAFACEDFWILKNNTKFKPTLNKPLVLTTKIIVPEVYHKRCVNVMPREYEAYNFKASPRFLANWRFHGIMKGNLFSLKYEACSKQNANVRSLRPLWVSEPI